MTTAWTIKLTRGAATFDLTSGRYNAATDFVPPAVREIPAINNDVLLSRKPQPQTFSFSVRVLGASDAEIRRGGQRLGDFLSRAGDRVTPMYLEVRQNSDIPFEPLWGSYGTNIRYRILHAQPPQVWDRISEADIRANGAFYHLSLTLSGQVEGMPIETAYATGGVREDTYGWADGRSRGLQIPEAVINLVTNPIFGHGTPGTSYTAGANVTASANYDKRFVIEGGNSMKLVSVLEAGSTVYPNCSYTCPVTTGDTTAHMISIYVKKENGTAVTADDCQIYALGEAATTTYTAIGDDGWSRLTAPFTGTAGADTIGLLVSGGGTVFTDGWQVEEKAYATPLAAGTMLGCIWTGAGTAHTVSSTRTVARVRIPGSVVNPSEGCIRLVLKWSIPSTAATADMTFYRVDATTFTGGYNHANTDIRMLDASANTADSAAYTWAAGGVDTFHFVWKGFDGMTVYKNGVSYATQASMFPAAVGTWLYIGTSATPAAHVQATFQDFSTYGRSLTAAQVLADATNIAQLTADGDRVGAIPWLWTNDGDNVIDNEDNGTRFNWAVVGGVPGTAPAEIILSMNSGAANLDNWDSFWISRLNLPVTNFWRPTGIINDTSTGATDSITTSKVAVQVAADIARKVEPLMGKQFHNFICGADAASSTIKFFAGLITPTTWTPTHNLFTTQTTDRVFWTPPMTVPYIRGVDNAGVGFYFVSALQRPTGVGTGNFVSAFKTVMFRPLARIDISSDTVRYGVQYYRGQSASPYTADSSVSGHLPITGDNVTLIPEEWNILQFLFGDDDSDTWEATDAVTLAKLVIVPGYQLL